MVETQVTALVEHTARALSQTQQALDFLTEEVDQMRKVVLQNQKALDFLTAAQGGTCTIRYTECCVYISDNKKTVSQVISALAKEAFNS